jgi:hypothetical protein
MDGFIGCRIAVCDRPHSVGSVSVDTCGVEQPCAPCVNFYCGILPQVEHIFSCSQGS